MLFTRHLFNCTNFSELTIKLTMVCKIENIQLCILFWTMTRRKREEERERERERNKDKERERERVRE